MIYSDIAIVGMIFAVFFDLYGVKTALLTKSVFWTSYAIIVPFQLITNWWLTSRGIVTYSPDAIIGTRIAGAPIEDLLFGFALVLSTMSLWVYWGRKGIQPKINLLQRKELRQGQLLLKFSALFWSEALRLFLE
jgi:lycopene cyclase domain-containing protein